MGCSFCFGLLFSMIPNFALPDPRRFNLRSCLSRRIQPAAWAVGLDSPYHYYFSEDEIGSSFDLGMFIRGDTPDCSDTAWCGRIIRLRLCKIPLLFLYFYFFSFGLVHFCLGHFLRT